MHEFGHRYLRIRPQSEDFSGPEWNTTPYSKSITLTDEENFAELFALSFWKDKHIQYREIIADFLKKVI
jgi:hypothetical protein